MKRKYFLIVIIILILVLSIREICLMTFKNTNLKINENIEKDNSNFISMMIENENGEYVENNDLKYPMENYLFNPEKSGCENGSKIKWLEETRQVQVFATGSDKCYAYFDKYDLVKDCEFNKIDSLACDIVRKKDNTLIYHDGKCDYENEENCDLEAGDFNYRFSGASDIVKNFVCLGNDNTAIGKCAENDLYRILGLFKNENNKYEIKLIKKTSIGTYKWDENNKNEWSTSSIKKVLNEEYFNNYLANKISSNIIIHNWIIPHINSSNVITVNSLKLAYLNELINPDLKTEDRGYIGLMYISDYGYAAYSKAWNKRLNSEVEVSYGSDEIKQNNWLFSGNIEWTMVGVSDNSAYVLPISNTGNVGWNRYDVWDLKHIRPTFYFWANTKIKSGNGSIESPYRIAY